MERFYMEPERVLSGTKKGYSKGSPLGTAKEPFQVLDGTFFSKSVVEHHRGQAPTPQAFLYTRNNIC